MSEPELAYMTGTNEDFDLPRWHTQTVHDSLSSSAQAAQSAAQANYLYNQAPPPPPAGRLPPIQQQQQPPSATSRQPRINQLLDEDHQFGVSSTPYSATSLARSLSLGGAPNSSRGRRHHLQDDLEGAFHVDGDTSQRQTPASLYPPSVAYHAQQAAAGNNQVGSTAGGDPYQDAYFTGPNPHTPKRSQTQHESSSSRAPRSPQRAPQSNNFLDPYSPPQYNSSSSNNYPYSPTSEGRSYTGGGGYSSQSHSRSQSQAKVEAAMTPPIASGTYSPQSSGQPPLYTGPYPMDTTSPAPSSNNNLTARHPRQQSISQPTTPLSFSHAHHSPAPGNTQYFAQEHQPMAVEPPPPKRRASGLRRIRDHRDLRPFVNPQPTGRRVDASGMPLSVRVRH